MKHIYTKSIIVVLFMFLSSFVDGQVLITNDGSTTPDGSSILEIKSDTLGILIPRLDKEDITTPVPGLLIFDDTEDAYYIYTASGWINISTNANIWSKNVNDVYLTDGTGNIGIGTGSPGGKFVVQADAGDSEDAVLFEVKDQSGQPIFKVTSEGVRIFVKDTATSKGVSGGFAIGRYGAAKGFPDTTYFSVTPYSTRVNTIEPKTKAVTGGFAVGRYGAAKADATPIFMTTPDSTRIYTTSSSKGITGGFAVGRYGAAKATDDHYMHITRENYFIGDSAGANTLPGIGEEGRFNVFLGYKSGFTNTSGNQNTFIGHSSGDLNESGHHNVFIGNNSGLNNTDGFDNVFIGPNSGLTSVSGSGNVYLGDRAGRNLEGSNNVILGNLAGGDDMTSRTGSGNIFVGYMAGYDETQSNRLYITNSKVSGDTALIYGEFGASPRVNLNGNLRFNLGNNSIQMPNSRGGSNQVMTSNGSGNTNWQTVTDLINKRILVVEDKDYSFDPSDEVYTLIMKSTSGGYQVDLPPIEESADRIINIRVMSVENPMTIVPVTGTIEGSGSIQIPKGGIYTLQANAGDGNWYIIQRFEPAP